MTTLTDDFACEVLSVVAEIPEGRVATYGQIARLSLDAAVRSIQFFVYERILFFIRKQASVCIIQCLENGI